MTSYEKELFKSGSQLHRLDEESDGDPSTESEGIISDDGGESEYEEP